MSQNDTPQDATPQPTLPATFPPPIPTPATLPTSGVLVPELERTRAVTIDLAYTADKSRVVPITHPDADSIFALAGSRIPENLARKYLPGDFATE